MYAADSTGIQSELIMQNHFFIQSLLRKIYVKLYNTFYKNNLSNHLYTTANIFNPISHSESIQPY